MKTIITHVATVCFLALAIAACKKDDNNNTAPVVPPSGSKLTTIAEVKSKYTNAAVTLENGIKIKGVVISDRDNGNIDSNKIVIQEGTGQPGILINLTTKMHTFKAGDVVEVGVSRQKLDLFDGDLSIIDLPVDSVRKTGTDVIQPRIATVKQVLDSATAWSGTLVTINNGLFTGGEIFQGTVDFADATGIVKSTTSNEASFKVRPLPFHEVNLTGIVRMHDGTVNVDMTSWYITFFDITDYKPAYTITEDFQQWPSQAATNPQLRTGVWSASSMIMYDKPTIQDGSYSTRNRILRGNSISSFLTLPMLKGLKSVTVVFAGSVTDTAFGSYAYQDELLSFNPDRDDVGVKLDLINWGGLITSAPYTTKELGKFHSVTYLVKKEDLATMDVDLDVNERLSIRNASSGTRRGNVTAVVIDKVILGFDQKDPGIDPALWDK